MQSVVLDDLALHRNLVLEPLQLDSLRALLDVQPAGESLDHLNVIVMQFDLFGQNVEFLDHVNDYGVLDTLELLSDIVVVLGLESGEFLDPPHLTDTDLFIDSFDFLDL